jgi:cupin fold WbuC family metalloprotein
MTRPPRFFGRECLDALSARAAESPRRRTNLNFHDTPEHPANRMLNAMEPDSYVRPHRHAAAFKDETFIVVKGAFGVVLFDKDGKVSHTAVLRPGGDLIGAHLPAGVFHSIVSLEPASVFFEVKAGPYDPAAAKDWAPWAPEEGAAEAPAYLKKLRALFTK